MKRVLAWLFALPLAVALGALSFGVLKDRAFADDHPVPGRLIRIGGFNIHAVETLGKGRAVIFIHGNPGTAMDFGPVQQRLSPKVRTIALDRPGYGWSDRPREEMTPRDQARMLHDAVKELNLSKPVLVGFSFGGPVITAWALEYPTEVGALVYVCAVADPVEGHPLKGAQSRLVEPWVGKLIAYGVGPFVAPASVEQGYVEAFSPQPVEREVVERGKLQFSRPTTLLASAWDWHVLETELPKLADRYGELKLPVEAISSNQDRIVGPSHIKYLGEHVPGIHVEHVDDAGHHLMATHPDAVVNAVLRAMNRLK